MALSQETIATIDARVPKIAKMLGLDLIEADPQVTVPAEIFRPESSQPAIPAKTLLLGAPRPGIAYSTQHALADETTRVISILSPVEEAPEQKAVRLIQQLLQLNPGSRVTFIDPKMGQEIVVDENNTSLLERYSLRTLERLFVKAFVFAPKRQHEMLSQADALFHFPKTVEFLSPTGTSETYTFSRDRNGNVIGTNWEKTTYALPQQARDKSERMINPTRRNLVYVDGYYGEPHAPDAIHASYPVFPNSFADLSVLDHDATAIPTVAHQQYIAFEEKDNLFRDIYIELREWLHDTWEDFTRGRRVNLKNWFETTSVGKLWTISSPKYPRPRPWHLKTS